MAQVTISLKTVEEADAGVSGYGWDVTFAVEGQRDFDIPVFVPFNDASELEIVKVAYERLQDLLTSLMAVAAPKS